MPLPADAPAWAQELALGFESGANSQFILHGNVHDRLPVEGRLVSLSSYLEDRLLAGFDVVFGFDLGNGLRILRGGHQVLQWPAAQGLKSLPREPRQAVEYLSHYVRYLANLAALGQGSGLQVAVILRGADQILPAGPGWGHELGGMVSLVRDWAGESPFHEAPFASLLIADSLNDLHPLVAFNPHAARVRVPLPDAGTLAAALAQLAVDRPAVFAGEAADTHAMARALSGVTVTAVESLAKVKGHQRQALTADDWVRTKKALVERDARDLVEFIESRRTLEDYHGQEALKAWLRQDIALWHGGDLGALPMGYLICGPVGTGKTYLVECLAGEAGVPVVRLKNFRDRWVGSSESNLETIFRLVRALGRCMVFVDEADQALGRRNAGGGDSGLSGRLYAMIAQEMSDSDNRGRIMWILASSRPDLIEVDLKRPGRVDVKVPLLPTTRPEESGALLRALLRKQGLDADAALMTALSPRLPLLLTPGAAEALAVKVYRQVRTSGQTLETALSACLEGYQNPVPADVMDFQMRLAVREASDLDFVPEALRHLATGGAA